MADIKGDLVPKYRLTDEQKGFQKKFARYQKVRKLLEAESMRIQYESKNVTDMWLELNKQMKTLQPPPEQVKELDGMNFDQQELPPKEDMMIRY